MSFLDGPRFVEGSIYARLADIHLRFGGPRYSGISPSGKYPAIFIFSGDEGKQFGYRDGWDTGEKFYTYTGEGQVGDMAFTNGNLAIRGHTADGRALYLFKKVSRRGGLYVYVGEMECESFDIVRGLDRDGSERDVIQFRLVRLREIGDNWADLVSGVASDVAIGVLRERAYAALRPSSTEKKHSVRTIYERSLDVVAYALMRADGHCELCAKPAPFLRASGQPYLEVHHVDRISDGGLDAPYKVAALCPTCHRLIHYGANGAKVNDRLRSKISSLEEEACISG